MHESLRAFVKPIDQYRGQTLESACPQLAGLRLCGGGSGTSEDYACWTVANVRTVESRIASYLKMGRRSAVANWRDAAVLLDTLVQLVAQRPEQALRRPDESVHQPQRDSGLDLDALEAETRRLHAELAASHADGQTRRSELAVQRQLVEATAAEKQALRRERDEALEAASVLQHSSADMGNRLAQAGAFTAARLLPCSAALI